MIDLDHLERQIAWYPTLNAALHPDDLRALVAELRAARVVVEAASDLGRFGGFASRSKALDAALDAYAAVGR